MGSDETGARVFQVACLVAAIVNAVSGNTAWSVAMACMVVWQEVRVQGERTRELLDMHAHLARRTLKARCGRDATEGDDGR